MNIEFYLDTIVCSTCNLKATDPKAIFCSNSVHVLIPPGHRYTVDEAVSLIKALDEAKEAKEKAAEAIKTNPSDDDMDDFNRLIEL